MGRKRVGEKTPSAGGSGKGGLVQFRADEALMAQLSQVADRFNVPIGVLSRLWITERLEEELAMDINTIRAWLQERYRAIDQAIEQDFNPGPIQIIHLVPFQRQLDIDPGGVRRFQGLLAPIERVDEFVGRINLDGYQTSKQFKTQSKLAGTVQVFRSGQVESIRQIRTDETGNVYGDRLDDDLIRAIWSYGCVLEALKVRPPVALLVGFKRMKGCGVKLPRSSSASGTIDRPEFRLQEIIVNDWSEVIDIDRAASTLKKILDQFANAAGFPRSMRYNVNGDWRGPIDTGETQVRTNRLIAKTEVIELIGTNRDANRVDLVLHDGSENVILGKVRMPYLEPTNQTRFKCLVNEDEMMAGSKQRLERIKDDKVVVVFSVGKLRFSGRITKLTSSPFGAGHVSQRGSQLLFDVEPVDHSSMGHRT